MTAPIVAKIRTRYADDSFENTDTFTDREVARARFVELATACEHGGNRVVWSATRASFASQALDDDGVYRTDCTFYLHIFA